MVELIFYIGNSVGKMPLEAASRRRKILHAGWADI